MSKVLKNMWGKSDKKGKQQSEAGANSQEQDPRPFDIDFKNMGKYDKDDITEFIWKYEQYIRDLRKKYQDMNEEYPALKQKVVLDDKERKRLTEELEQYKLQCQNLKAYIEQTKISGSTLQKEGAQKSGVNLETLLAQYINPEKILGLPAVNELQKSFQSVLESTQELFRGFDAMEKVDFHDEGHHAKVNHNDTGDNEEGENKPKQPDEFHLVEEKMRQALIKVTNKVQKAIEKSSADFEGFLKSIQEKQSQLSFELTRELDYMLKSSSNFGERTNEFTDPSTGLGVSASKILRESLEKQIQELRNVCLDYEKSLKALEGEKKHLIEAKRDGESKLTELRRQADEHSKVVEDLLAQNQLLENNNGELEDQLSTHKRTLAELKQKLERSEKDLKNSKESEQTLTVQLGRVSEEGEHKGREMSILIWIKLFDEI